MKEFKTDHSHTFAIQTHVQFLRSNRIVSNGALAMARTMRRSGIRTCHIMTFMAQQAGGYEYMPYLSKDLYNHIGSDGDVAFVDADAARAIGYLEHKKDHDSGFFGKYSYDGERRLLNLIWADTRCRSDFAAYGHAIAFDTTYKTNGYGKPLLIWVGINRHNKTTVLGFAILVNETVKTYKWVIDAFIECMNGKIPETVVTDGDLAICSAISELMPRAKHRLCSWHIERNAAQNIKNTDFPPRLAKLLFRYYNENEFQIKWNKLVVDFKLGKNAWMSLLYQRRKTWAETYLRGNFYVGMSTT